MVQIGESLEVVCKKIVVFGSIGIGNMVALGIVHIVVGVHTLGRNVRPGMIGDKATDLFRSD